MAANKPKSPRKNPAPGTWLRIIEGIDTPLGFYVLALLIVETFLASGLIFSNLTEEHQFWGMLAGVGLFVFVVAVVSLLACFRPHYLMYDRDAHLLDRGTIVFGTEARVINEVTPLPITELEPRPATKRGS